MKRTLSALLAFIVLILPCAAAMASSQSPAATTEASAAPTTAPLQTPDATNIPATRSNVDMPTPVPSPSPIPSLTPEPTPTAEPTPSPLSEAPTHTVLKLDSVGDEVIMLQQRLQALGYFSYKVTGHFGKYTETAVIAFQAAHGLKPDGQFGETTASYLYSPTARIGTGVMRATPKPTPKPTPKAVVGKLIEWTKAASLVPRWNGNRFKVRDFRTGVEYYMKRVGGTLHMDVAPASKADTAAFKKTYGGRWSWTRRPVLVRIGSTWYAASINGYPHGSASISGNGMTGQVCIHFLNSKTHVREMKDPEHQRCVQIAAGKK